MKTNNKNTQAYIATLPRHALDRLAFRAFAALNKDGGEWLDDRADFPSGADVCERLSDALDEANLTVRAIEGRAKVAAPSTADAPAAAPAKDARPLLSFDGCGINGPDLHRSRLCTFVDSATAAAWGPLLALAPDLRDALRDRALPSLRDCAETDSDFDSDVAHIDDLLRRCGA